MHQRVPLLAVLLVVLVFAGLAVAGRNSGGTYSLPAGNPVVTGTTITSSWANSTLNDISTELTNSLDRQGRGAMLAPLQLTAGTAGAPALTWALEPSSGWYRAAANDLRFSVAGTDAFKIGSAANVSSKPLTNVGRLTTDTLTVNTDSAKLTINPLGANDVGLTVKGTGTGSAIAATAGTTGNVSAIQAFGNGAAAGIIAYGGSTGDGINGLGGASGGYGITGQAAASGFAGLRGIGAGSGPGILATGGASSGRGITANAGGGNADGINANGAGTGSGINATGGSSGPGITTSPGTAATGATRQDALIVNNGDLNMDGQTAPDSTTAIKNRLTKKNITKVWMTATIGAPATTVTILNAFNVTSAAMSQTNPLGNFAQGNDTMTVTFAQCFTNSNYVVTLGARASSCVPIVNSKNACSVTLNFAQPLGRGFANTYCSQSTVGSTYSTVSGIPLDNNTIELAAFGDQ